MTERLEVHSVIWATFSDSRVYTGHTYAHIFYCYCTTARLQNRKTLEIQKIQISTTDFLAYLKRNVAKFIQKTVDTIKSWLECRFWAVITRISLLIWIYNLKFTVILFTNTSKIDWRRFLGQMWWVKFYMETNEANKSSQVQFFAICVTEAT